jgi:hypothetical protein
MKERDVELVTEKRGEKERVQEKKRERKKDFTCASQSSSVLPDKGSLRVSLSLGSTIPR